MSFCFEHKTNGHNKHFSGEVLKQCTYSQSVGHFDFKAIANVWCGLNCYENSLTEVNITLQ